VPPKHIADACARLHAVVQEPQCCMSADKSASQPFARFPSQSPKPELHTIEHVPALQAGVP
jgi:hypothetical protein